MDPQTTSARGIDLDSGWDYAAAPESMPVEIAPRYGLFIDGGFRAPKSRKYFETVNPATEETLARVAHAGLADVDAAVEAARRALPKWRKLKPAQRAKYLFRIARRIQERSRELAVLETMDNGKPIRETRDFDVPEAAKHFFHHAGWADKLDYAFPGRRARPVGVCAQIIPWNFPLLMTAWKIAPALACGNTVVLKPAETSPLTALRLAEILQEVDLPPGVVNIITGDGTTGAALAGHKGVQKLAFTGSTEVGKQLAAQLAGSGKRLTLELGGKSPQIVFDDASLDQAVEGIVAGIWTNQGQICSAGSRLLVQEGIHDEMVARLDLRLRTLRIGDPLDKNTDIGAIHSRAQWERVSSYLRIGKEEGATLHQGGHGTLPDRGWWIRPGYFAGVEPSYRVSREEIFGPILAITSFRTPEEALKLANDTGYGLAAGIWTDKGSKIFATAARLKAGVVWCNTFNRFDATSPFGGYRESGFGREGGLHGLRAYVNLEAGR